MGFDQIFIFGVLILAFVALVIDRWSPDIILVTALAIVTLGGVIDIRQAAESFGNTTLMALGSLYILAAALRKSGALEIAGKYVLGKRSKNIYIILTRMCTNVSLYSAFLNNTPIVAMGIPAVRSWSQKNRIPVSKLLIPLSFAAILGGMCTLIGTSTNLIADGLLKSYGLHGLSFFEVAWLGVPCALVGLLYLIFISPILTPIRRDIRFEEEINRELLLELEVTDKANLAGRTVEEAKLQTLQGFFLTRINRQNQEIAPVSKDEQLQTDDHLLYAAETGRATKLPDLSNFPGVQLVVQPPRRIKRQKKDRELHQVVIKEGSQLAGMTIEEAAMPERYGAAVTGARRRGKRIERPLEQIRLQPGDVLLLDTRRGFGEVYENTPDFYLTSKIGGEAPEETKELEEQHPGDKGKDLYLSVSVLIGIVTLVAAGILHIALAGILGVSLLIMFNVIEAGEARKSVDWTVLIVIGASLGLGKAMAVSGTAKIIANGMVHLTSEYGPRAVLSGMVITTGLLTNIITNNGAIALMFPIVSSIAQSQGIDPRGLFIGVTLAASMSLLTPISYQTNLMVYGPGNYRFSDFLKVGFPLQIILWLIVIILTPYIWPF